MRLLLVEDDAKLAAAVCRGLRGEGYAVDHAADGDEALADAHVWDYDAVVLDLMLPRRDGFEVCRTLRERGDGVPILMLTARGNVDDRIRGLDAGADDYLAKPFDLRWATSSSIPPRTRWPAPACPWRSPRASSRCWSTWPGTQAKPSRA